MKYAVWLFFCHLADNKDTEQSAVLGAAGPEVTVLMREGRHGLFCVSSTSETFCWLTSLPLQWPVFAVEVAGLPVCGRTHTLQAARTKPAPANAGLAFGPSLRVRLPAPCCPPRLGLRPGGSEALGRAPLLRASGPAAPRRPPERPGRPRPQPQSRGAGGGRGPAPSRQRGGSSRRRGCGSGASAPDRSADAGPARGLPAATRYRRPGLGRRRGLPLPSPPFARGRRVLRAAAGAAPSLRA